MFYLSGYLERHREEYVGLLRPLNSKQEGWNAWIAFFMRAIEEQSENNARALRSILSLYAELKQRVLELTHSQYAIPFLDSKFSQPVFKPADLFRRENMPSRAQLGNFLRLLKNADIMTAYTEGKGRTPEVLILPSLINLCEGRSVFLDPLAGSED